MTERIALVAFWKNYDRNLYVRAAQLADELGYDSFWLPEAWGYESLLASHRAGREDEANQAWHGHHQRLQPFAGAHRDVGRHGR